VVICAIAVGAVWMVLGLDPGPVPKSTADERAARPLAYQQAIAEPREAEPSKKDEDSKTADIPPFETVTSEQPGATTSGATDPEASDAPQDMPQDMASLPDESADPLDGTSDWPGEGVDSSNDMAALPGEAPAPYDGVPPLPGEADAGADQWGTDGAEQWRDERQEPWAYGPPAQGDPRGRPRQGDPYEAQQRDPYEAQQADPYGPPAQADPYGPPQAEQWDGQEATERAQNTEEWVEVIISGAAMRSAAAEDGPMLFAFPYGRNLKVVSRYEGWVEVTDPKSAATGWMQAHVVAPSRANRQQPYTQNEAYYDDEPRRGRRGGWFKRNGGGFADMINRAIGGGN